MDDQENFKLLKISDVITLLERRDQEEQIVVYVGCAREFTSDYGWECSSEDDSLDLQLFTKRGLK